MKYLNRFLASVEPSHGRPDTLSGFSGFLGAVSHREKENPDPTTHGCTPSLEEEEKTTPKNPKNTGTLLREDNKGPESLALNTWGEYKATNHERPSPLDGGIFAGSKAPHKNPESPQKSAELPRASPLGSNPKAFETTANIAKVSPTSPAGRFLGAFGVFGGPEEPPKTWRTELACWPPDWRERWGRLANEFEAGGVTYPESEHRAFVETAAELRAAIGRGALTEGASSRPPAPPLIPDHAVGGAIDRAFGKHRAARLARPTARGPRDVRRGDRWLPWHFEPPAAGAPEAPPIGPA